MSPSRAEPFAIVGVGASAGGLEAVRALLVAVPADAPLAFVVVLHLDPTQPSALPEIFAKTSPMPVMPVRDGVRVERGHVYVMPPGVEVTIADRILRLSPRPGRAKRHPIDRFFVSLAESEGERAFGVVLSGGDADGTEGLRLIKDAGGITFAQEPGSALVPTMPESAIAAGVADHQLAPAAIAIELTRLSRHPYVASAGHEPEAPDEAQLSRVFKLLSAGAGRSYAEYKRTTFVRRLARRMAVRRARDLDEYVDILELDTSEVAALAEDALIHVTCFFRDPRAFDALVTLALPKIIAAKPPGAPIRIWVAGCGTGEETYSIAMLLLELFPDPTTRPPIQIFSSDVSAKVIAIARSGLYPQSALTDVSADRLAHFFVREDDHGYRVRKGVRDLCVFVVHDLTRDPPFSRLDLVSCRNVLIYFEPALQKRLIPLFQHCLTTPGYLFLGAGESVAPFGALFTAVDAKQKVFARTSVKARAVFPFARRTDVDRPRSNAPGALSSPSSSGLLRRADEVLLARYVAPAVLVDERMDILQFRGRTGLYLEASSGQPNLQLARMARDGIATELRVAFARAKKTGELVRREGVRFRDEGRERTVTLEIVPLAATSHSERSFLVLFLEPAESPARRPVAKTAHASLRASHAESGRLRDELALAQDDARQRHSDHESANAEFLAANEELQSTNEELQSTNEELETAKEELQSTNEELVTLNDELQNRNREATEVSADLANLVAAIDVAIVIVTSDRRIRRFTPRAKDVMNLLPSDIGRPIDDIRPNLDVPALDRWIAESIETLEVREAEVLDRRNRWTRIQIRPYMTADRRIDGAVVTFVDIDDLKRALAASEDARGVARAAQRVAESADVAKDAFLATLSHELRTPMSAITMTATMLMRDGVRPADVKRMASRLERAARLQERMIEDLLDVTRIVSGKLDLKHDEVDLSLVVAAAVDTVRLQAEAKGVKLVRARSRERYVVRGDAARLAQVVWNLLGNAIKFTPAKGRITITLAKTGTRRTISVHDTGAGISAELLPQIFDRFVQGDRRASGTSGLGLGLSIVRHLVEAHGGTVHATSGGRGTGTTFVIDLPACDAPPVGGRLLLAAPRSRPAPKGKKKRVRSRRRAG